MARTIFIQYGALRVGLTPSNANLRLADKYVLDINHETFRCQFTVLITGTAAEARTAEIHLLSELRRRDQALTVTSSAGVRHTFDPADGTNTGLLTRGSAIKPPSATNTETSREYLCEVIGQLPEDGAGRSGRREGRVVVGQDASERRRVRATGSYTASGANTSIQQYAANVDDWINAELTALTGSWNTVERTYDFDDRKKVLSFALEYEEIIHPESQGGTDLASVTRQQIVVRRATFGDARSRFFSDVKPLELVEIAYSASIRKGQTQDLSGLYTGTLRAHVLAQVSDSLIVLREEPIFDPDNNRLSVRIVARVPHSGFVDARVRVRKHEDLGKLLLPVWDGGLFSRRAYQGLASEMWSVSIETLSTLGTPDNDQIAIPSFLLDESKYVRLFGDFLEDEFDQGAADVAGGTVRTFVVRTAMYVFARAEAPASEQTASGVET